jgi:hypothetical protein
VIAARQSIRAIGGSLSCNFIAQSIEFIGRFGDEQRRLGQKCRLASSAHVLTLLNFPRPGELVGETNVQRIVVSRIFRIFGLVERRTR